MTAAFYDQVVTVGPAPALTLVRDTDTIQAPPQAPTAKTDRKGGNPPFGGGCDPLVDGAARLLSIPLRHMYAALWRAGVLEVRA